MKRKCKVCGSEYELAIESHYISRDVTITGLAAMAKKEEEKLFDTFDCPVCGCQDVIQERKRPYSDELTIDTPEDTDNGDNEEEIDYDREEDCFGDYGTFSMCRRCERKDGCKKASKAYEVESND